MVLTDILGVNFNLILIFKYARFFCIILNDIIYTVLNHKSFNLAGFFKRFTKKKDFGAGKVLSIHRLSYYPLLLLTQQADIGVFEILNVYGSNNLNLVSLSLMSDDFKPVDTAKLKPWW